MLNTYRNWENSEENSESVAFYVNLYGRFIVRNVVNVDKGSVDGNKLGYGNETKVDPIGGSFGRLSRNPN